MNTGEVWTAARVLPADLHSTQEPHQHAGPDMNLNHHLEELAELEGAVCESLKEALPHRQESADLGQTEDGCWNPKEPEQLLDFAAARYACAEPANKRILRQISRGPSVSQRISHVDWLAKSL